MSCFTPLEAYRHKDEVTFTKPHGLATSFPLPCGQCIGCRLRNANEWAVRCMQEASFHEENSFITLTYNNEHLPSDHSLNIMHFQKFMKRLRKKISDDGSDKKIKFFHCGEYGSALSRPHYHAIIFGHAFSDERLHSYNGGKPLYISEELSALWTVPGHENPIGFSTIAEVNHETAAYVARYCTKKITGDLADLHYEYVDDYGQLHTNLQPEYMSCSNGIGKRHYEKWRHDIYDTDGMGYVRNGEFQVIQPPRYYDNLYKKDFPQDFEALKKRRVSETLLKRNDSDHTKERLAARLLAKKLQTKTLKRTFEETPCNSSSSQFTTAKLKPIFRPSSYLPNKWRYAPLAIASTLTTISLENIQRTTPFRTSVSSMMKLAQLQHMTPRSASATG